jgi:arginine deiminase
VHDELTSALREDTVTVPYVPEHLTETIVSTLATEREVFIQELIQRLAHTQMLHSNVQTLHTTARAQIHAQAERMRVLESTLDEKKEMEIELDSYKRRCKGIQEELDRAKGKEETLHSSILELQVHFQYPSGALEH